MASLVLELGLRSASHTASGTLWKPTRKVCVGGRELSNLMLSGEAEWKLLPAGGEGPA